MAPGVLLAIKVAGPPLIHLAQKMFGRKTGPVKINFVQSTLMQALRESEKLGTLGGPLPSLEALLAELEAMVAKDNESGLLDKISDGTEPEYDPHVEAKRWILWASQPLQPKT